MSYHYALLASAVILWLVYRYLICNRSSEDAASLSNDKKQAPEQEDPLQAYQNIQPLRDFDLESTPPMKLRPFKPKYHLTMALETVPLSDLLQMDNTYLSRIKLRRQLMDAHPKATLACNDVAIPATLELYDWLVGTYLPRRFPTCFSLVHVVGHEAATAEPDGDSSASNHDISPAPTHLLNRLTSEHLPLHHANPLTALRTLSSHIDTDFLILLPQPEPTQPPSPTQTPPQTSPSQHPPQPQYHLQSFATTFPSGFSTLSKLSLPLSAIHSPVPAYAQKLSRSMDRYFARLPIGVCARRANWTITTTSELFVESGTHMHSSSAPPSTSPAAEIAPSAAAAAAEAAATASNTASSIATQKADLATSDIHSFRLRCELQTLHRLPSTGALVFAFKTYSYGLEEVKAEGNGEALAEATEGFAKGSVPEMSFYKREAVWGDKVRGFLRG